MAIMTFKMGEEEEEEEEEEELGRDDIIRRNREERERRDGRFACEGATKKKEGKAPFQR